jgi:hypothetical protein
VARDDQPQLAAFGQCRATTVGERSESSLRNTISILALMQIMGLRKGGEFGHAQGARRGRHGYRRVLAPRESGNLPSWNWQSGVGRFRPRRA